MKIKKLLPIVAASALFVVPTLSTNFKNEQKKNENQTNFELLVQTVKNEAKSYLVDLEKEISIKNWKEIYMIDPSTGEKIDLILFVFEEQGYCVLEKNTLISLEMNFKTKISEKEFENIEHYYISPLWTKNQKSNEALKPATLLSTHNSNSTTNKKEISIDSKLLKQRSEEIEENLLEHSKNKITATGFRTKKIKRLSKAKNKEINPRYEVATADYEVPYSWWFRNNLNMFGYATQDESYFRKYWNQPKPPRPKFLVKGAYYDANGMCMLNALSMLVQYQHLFINSKWISEEMEKKYIISPDKTGWYEDYEIFKEGWETIRNIRHKNLPAFPYVSPGLSLEFWKYGYRYKFGGSSELQLKKTLNKFMSNNSKFKNYKYKSFAGAAQKPWEQIYKGHPTLLAGRMYDPGTNNSKIDHAIVAYGKWHNKWGKKHRDKYLTHFGWEGSSQVIFDFRLTRAFGMYFTIIDKTPKDKRVTKPFFAYGGKMVSAKELENETFE